jgi:hypothetical protein
MAAFSSIVYTIGTALDRAREGGMLVEVLVEGHWLEGLVVASDGHGVVLENGGDDHVVVRLENISAVRVADRAPMLGIVEALHHAEGASRFDGAVPMPGPRAAAV